MFKNKVVHDPVKWNMDKSTGYAVTMRGTGHSQTGQLNWNLFHSEVNPQSPPEKR